MDTAGNSNNAFVAAVLLEVSDERGKDRDGPLSTSCVFCGVATFCPPVSEESTAATA